MDIDQLLVTSANNIVLSYSSRELKGEAELLLYLNACDMLSARFRVATHLWNKLNEDFENGQNPDSR